MRVKYLAQEHNAVPRPGLEPGPPDLESSALTIRPPRLPHFCGDGKLLLLLFLLLFISEHAYWTSFQQKLQKYLY